jgi:hypothetical protein
MTFNPSKIAAVTGMLLNVPVWAGTGHPWFACGWFAIAVVVTLWLPAR